MRFVVQTAGRQEMTMAGRAQETRRKSQAKAIRETRASAMTDPMSQIQVKAPKTT
jgi:hypothetical protein